MIRTHQLLIGPNETRLTRHQAPAVWDGAQPTVESNIYGPDLEDLAREWTALHAAPDTLGGNGAPNAGGARLLLFTAATPKVPPGESRHAEIIDLERLYTGS
jgi:hypothetical protein